MKRTLLVAVVSGLGLAAVAAFALTDENPPRTHDATRKNGSSGSLGSVVPAAAVSMAPSMSPAALIDLATRDPEAVVAQAITRYERDVRDYACLFTKQERINGKLRQQEAIRVRYRVEPQSVFMIWERNADQARRVLFIDKPEYVDKHGRKTAKVEPNGSIARLFVSEIMMPIDGSEARASSRRTIDEFGFRELLDLLVRYNTLAAKNGVLDFRFDHVGEIDGRPTLVFVRHLPYDPKNETYPDAKLIIHIDQEWLVPTALYSYSDREGKTLLGSYEFSDVTLNPGYSDADFKF